MGNVNIRGDLSGSDPTYYDPTYYIVKVPNLMMNNSAILTMMMWRATVLWTF